MAAFVKFEKTNLISFFRKKLQCYKYNWGTVHVRPATGTSRCMVLISISISLGLASQLYPTGFHTIFSKSFTNELPSSVQRALREGRNCRSSIYEWEHWGLRKGGEFSQLHSKPMAGLKAPSSLHLIPWVKILFEMKLPQTAPSGNSLLDSNLIWVEWR